MSSELFTVCFWADCEARQSQYISYMCEKQGGGLIREQFPSNTTPAKVREPAPLLWKQNCRVVDLLVNYVCSIFNLYFFC